MKILFAIGVGILPEQRVNRWQMVSTLYAQLGQSFKQLGHQIYYYVHPEALVNEIPKDHMIVAEDHVHFAYVLQKFKPDFTFCWNGSSFGDTVTTTHACQSNSKMIYSEQGWFPQKTSIYFDFQGCNAKSSIANVKRQKLNDSQYLELIAKRNDYINEVGWPGGIEKDTFTHKVVDSNKPIFVPLQDERDLNIVQDSPFKSMNSFVSFLSKVYPNAEFRVRPHPKYPKPYLAEYENVTLDNPKKPMFESLAECGLVIGINSTTLQESALLGYPVISFGKSLATGTGLFVDASERNFPRILSEVSVNKDEVEAILFELLCRRQFLRQNLGNANKVANSWLYREMIVLSNWNKIYK